MRAKTEELLHMLLWTCEMISRPTWRNLNESFEGWAYRNGLRWQLARLERQRFIESQGPARSNRLYRLTEAGRLHSIGGRDPEACWRRRWDGRWRLVLFDIPRARSAARDKLRLYLRNRGFGYLQDSVWITPDPVTQEREVLSTGDIDVESLILLEAWPGAGETDEQIVAGAWDFPLINRGYEKYLMILDQRPQQRIDNESAAKSLQCWVRQERLAWQEAVSVDPLLPERLLPSDYLGQRAWRERVQLLTDMADQIRSFKG